MILSTPEELNALLPANVSTSPERLLTLMEQTERTHIVPLLGKPLYKAALFRHLTAFEEGEIYDKESKLPHLAHMAWNAIALLHFSMKTEKHHDNNSNQSDNWRTD